MLRCTPDRGSVHSGSTLDLELTLNFMEPQVVSTQLTVEVRGGKPVKMPIRGEAVLPAIDIQEPTLDMGSVYTGVVARMPLTVVNTTPVVAGEESFSCPSGLALHADTQTGLDRASKLMVASLR